MKNTKFKNLICKIGILAILTIVVLSSVPVQAVDKYTVLAPLPGTTDCNKNINSTTCKTDLKTYLPGLFNLAIGLAAVFAVLMIVIGGFTYMSSDALLKKEEGKNRMWNAIKGLVLVIAAWLILATINPALLTLDLNIEPATISAPAGGSLGGGASPAGTRMTGEQIVTSNAVRTSLGTEGVLVYADPCTLGQTTGCVNMNGISSTLLDGMVLLKRTINDTITITGGTEGGHSAGSSHYTGNALDLRFSTKLNSYIETNRTPVSTQWGPQYTVTVSGQTMTFLKESNPDHWHVQPR